jgi:hypothetical protein
LTRHEIALSVYLLGSLLATFAWSLFFGRAANDPPPPPGVER